jgi:hypothetical protein
MDGRQWMVEWMVAWFVEARLLSLLDNNLEKNIQPAASHQFWLLHNLSFLSFVIMCVWCFLQCLYLARNREEKFKHRGNDGENHSKNNRAHPRRGLLTFFCRGAVSFRAIYHHDATILPPFISTTTSTVVVCSSMPSRTSSASEIGTSLAATREDQTRFAAILWRRRIISSCMRMRRGCDCWRSRTKGYQRQTSVVVVGASRQDDGSFVHRCGDRSAPRRNCPIRFEMLFESIARDGDDTAAAASSGKAREHHVVAVSTRDRHTAG